MHLESEALAELAQDPRGETLVPLYYDLAALLSTRTISERVRFLGRYLELIETAPTWAELPYADDAADIHRIYSILTDSSHQFVTSLISASRIDDRYYCWKTTRDIPQFEHDAVTGLTAMMFILAHRGYEREAQRLASALRGRTKRRKMTREETRAERAGDLQVERVDDVLKSLALAPSPAQQYRIVLDDLQRIRHAKPNFSEVINWDLQKCFSPADEAEPPAVGIAYFPLRKTGHEADAPDEELGEEIYTHYSDLLDRSNTSLEVQRSYHEQVIWSSNRLLLEGHVTALTKVEAESFSNWLRTEAVGAKSNAEVKRLTSIIHLLLVMITGRTLDNVDALLRSAVSQQWSPVGLIDLQQGQIILPAPMPEGSFQPTEEAQDYLLPTSDYFALSLPPKLLDFLNSWATSGSALIATGDRERIDDLLAEYRETQELDISLGRIRQYLSTRLMTLGKDPAIVRWISGDSHGHATGYLHYAHVQAADLAETYTRAVWPLFGEGSNRPSKLQNGAVGSRAVPKKEYVAQCVKKLSHRFNAPQFSPDEPGDLAGRQNLMATYVSSMLTAVSGHRISGALLELQRGDFLLSLDGKNWLGVATFSDKRQDSAHYYRPVPLGEHAAEQLGLYLLHLEALESQLNQLSAPESGLQSVRAALDGSGPLFFWLDPDLGYRPAKFELWHDEFKSNFPHLPSNFGRHYLAHHFRSGKQDVTDPESSSETPGGGELACLVLGHLPVIGDPFGHDSPTDIISMAINLTGRIDEIYKSQAWVRRGGLVQAPRRFRPNDIRPPELRLKSWDPERQALEKGLQAQQTRINQTRKKRFDDEKKMAEEEFLTALHQKHPKLAKVLTDDPGPGSAGSEPLKLTRQQLSETLSNHHTTPHDDETQRGKATWIKLRVARVMLEAAQRNGLYQGPLPAKPHNLAHGDRTPLLPGMYRAHETLSNLRKEYPEILAQEDLKEISNQTADRLYGHLALTSILYGSVWTLPVLEGLLRNFRDYRRSPAYPDSILVELDIHPPTTWALWGLPALLMVKFAQVQGMKAPPDPGRLALSIYEILPSAYRPEQAAQTLNYLLDTASVVARIELSGAGRLSLGADPNTCSWSLPLARQIPLLEGKEDPRPTAPYTPPERTGKARQGQRSSDWYKWLCAVIPPDSTKAADTKEQRQKVETNRQHRKPAVKKIKQEMEARQLSEIEQALGYWLIQMLYSRKGSSTELFAHKTVYNYLTSIAPRLLDQIQDRNLAEIEDDEWSDIYEFVLFGHKEGTLNRKLLQIQRLHKLMERNFSVRPLPDECLPVKAQVESRVRNSLALPAEINSALDGYQKSVTSRNVQPCGEREILQAYIAFMLLAATGSRIGEVCGLQHRDIMIVDEEVLVRIRINAFRRIKTRAAARVIPLSLRQDEIATIERFLKAERKRLGDPHFRPTRLVFLDLSHQSRGLPLGTDPLRPYITGSLRQASPVHLISYDIRHTRGTFLQVEMALSPAPTASPASTTETITLPVPEPNLLRLPRWTFSRAMVMGHARPRTTNHSYGGMPWVYLAPTAQRQTGYITDEAVGALLGIETSNATRSLLRHADEKAPWLLDRLSPPSPQQPRRSSTQRSVNIDQLRQENIPDALIYLLYARDKKQEDAYPSYGLLDREYHRIRESAQSIMEETRFTLLHSLARGKKLGKAGALPRWYAGSESLLAITSEMTKPSSAIWEIASSYRQMMNPIQSQGNILLDLDKGEQLASLIEKHAPQLKIDTQEYGNKVRVSLTMGSRSLNRHLGWILAAVEVLSPLLHPPLPDSRTSTPH